MPRAPVAGVRAVGVVDARDGEARSPRSPARSSPSAGASQVDPPAPTHTPVVRPYRPRRVWPDCPVWSGGTRLWVLTMVVVLLAFVWWHVRQFTVIVVSAVLLAYILNPLIERTERRLRLTRARAAFVIYMMLLLAVALVPAGLTPGVVRTLTTMDVQAQWDRFATSILAELPASVDVLGQTVALDPLYEEMRRQLRSAEGAVLGRQSIVWLAGVASGFAFTVFGVFITVVTSLYIAMDSTRFVAWIARKVPEPYHPVYLALRDDIAAVWQAFFRGQLVLAVVVGGMTWIGLIVLGVPYAGTLALVAGVLEVVPRVGPVLATVPAVIVAAVQPSATLPALPRGWFVLLVIGLYIVIQQVENNFLVPRILGGSVNLPAAVILVGAMAGATVAGVMGILLAAPVLGSVRVLGSWIFHQLTRYEDSGETEAAPPRALETGSTSNPCGDRFV
jgi:predicted PurR-regulated permease PerM